MRTPESKIKEAILHPWDEVREQALDYFSKVRSRDETIMPLVIRAVEEFGRDNAFSILRPAEFLVQSEPTVEWLMTELQQEYDGADVDEENYRYAAAIALMEADPRLLAPRESQILALPNFPEVFCAPLHERVEMSNWNWDRCFEALMNFGLDTMRRQVTQNDLRYGNRLVKALARHPEQAGKVCDLLKRPFRGKDRSLVLWLEPQVMVLASKMRIEAAIPFLMQQAMSEREQIMDAATNALTWFGTDAVVRAIDGEWQYADQNSRSLFAIYLADIHSDESVKKCHEFLAGEEDAEVQLILANSLLGNFDEDAIELCWPMVDNIGGDDLDGDRRDLRYRLVAIATIMGKTFPHFEEWHRAALHDNWGWFTRDHDRLADAFKPDAQARNGP